MFRSKAKTSDSRPPAGLSPTRTLVVGARGLPADLCVEWADPIPNVADFDAAIVVAPTLEVARTINDDSFSEYRKRFRQLLESNGVIHVLAGPRESWRSDGQSVIFGHRDTYDWCPVWVTVEAEAGTTITNVHPEVAWFFRPIQRWELLLSHPPSEGQPRQTRAGGQLLPIYEVETLAANRAGQPLGTRVRYALHEVLQDAYELQSRIRTEPSLVSGWTYFLGIASPWTPETAAAAVLQNVYGRAGSSPIPYWVTSDMFPPTQVVDTRIAALEAEIESLRTELTDAESLRGEQREVIGLLYESGARLEDLVADAFREFGVALGEAVAEEEYTALLDGVLAAVEVKGNSKSASQDDYRALLDYLARHDLTDDYAVSRGILVVNAWRNKPPVERGPSFPDNVQRAAAAQGRIALVSTHDLYDALILRRSGNVTAADAFVAQLFVRSGAVSLGDGA